MLCRKCGHNHLTTLEQLACDHPRANKPPAPRGDSSGKAPPVKIQPGANVSDVSESEKAETWENPKTGISDPVSIFVTPFITKGRPRRYETNAARQKAYRERRAQMRPVFPTRVGMIRK